MILATSSLLLSLSITTLTTAHFVLQSPPSLGFSDTQEATSPCGSFPITNRDKVTQFPVAGYPIHVLSTHTKSIFQYRAALLNNTESFVNLIPQVAEAGVGDYCLPAVPGVKEWVGLDAVLQVVQFGPDGVLFQCAAITFSEGAAAAVGSDFKDASGVQAVFTTATNTLPGQITLAPATASPSGAISGTGNSSVAATPTPTTGGSKPSPTTSSTSASSSKNAAAILKLNEISKSLGFFLVVLGMWFL